MDRGGWQPTVHGVARVGHDLPTEPPHVGPSSLTKDQTPGSLQGECGFLPLGHQGYP